MSHYRYMLVGVAAVLMTVHAGAAELSPWLGNDSQVPFQLDPNTMVAVTFAADPLQTGSLPAVKCNQKTCLMNAKPAKSESTNP